MKPILWWKNFALGIELDAAGTFIYNGIRALHELRNFQHPVDSFEVLYNLSVGVERLLKVTIILVEHSDDDLKKLEKSLITHNTVELVARLDKQRPLSLSAIHREFLSILSKFYKSYRYGRYSSSTVPNIYEEKRTLLLFLKKHLKLNIDPKNTCFPVYNSNTIRRFIGGIVKTISRNIFNIINERSRELNIYTYELRSDSKAGKVFYCDRLDFIKEELKKKELILFLMNPKVTSKYIELLRSLAPLELDTSMAANYIKALLNNADLPYVEYAVDEAYTELDNIKERLHFLEAMDRDFFVHDNDDEEEDA